MKKKYFLIPVLCLLVYSYCGDSTSEIKIDEPSNKIFKNISINKTFSLNQVGGGVCIPFSKGFVVYEVLGGRHFLNYYDIDGNFRKNAELNFGQGPNDIFSMTFWFLQDDNIMFVDNNTYLKTIDPINLKIETIQKISNKIKNYQNSFVFVRRDQPDVEYSNGHTITSFAANTFRNDDFYIVSYTGVFDNFKILHKVHRVQRFGSGMIDINKPNELVHDYRSLIVGAKNLAVDWKNGFVYFIQYHDKPEIFRIDFNGGDLTNIKLAINSSDFFTDRDKINSWYQWAVDDTPRRFKTGKKHIYKYPETSPVLRDIAIIGEWLLVISGKRNWETYENKVFVYRLSDLQFSGTFYIPTGDWASSVFGNHLVTKRIIEKDGDYLFELNCYRIEVL